jgi:AbrB family looped-hinge helix DNA binding protein
MKQTQEPTPTKSQRVKVADGGRVVIPQPFREAMGIDTGDEVLVRQDEGGIHIVPFDVALRQARDLIARYIPPNIDLTAELLKMRREDSSLD